MIAELGELLERCPQNATHADYKFAIIEQNVLLKPSATTRAKTFSFLRDRYALDPGVLIFRVMRLLWATSLEDRPLLAMLVAVARDGLMQATTDLILNSEPGQAVSSSAFSSAIELGVDKSLSVTTLETAGERATSSWKQSGHLRLTRQSGIRQRVTPAFGSATLALLLGHLCGLSGPRLLESDWAKLLDASSGDMLALAEEAGQRGLIEYRNAGGVLQITFNQLMRMAE
jgi:hypothetical protein